ncbi:MAG: PAS domain S-box protein, partial [Paludibacter sp.]
MSKAMSTFKKHKKSYTILLVNLLLIAMVVVLYNATEKVIKTDKEERHLNKITLHLDSVLISLKDAQRGERGFVISGNETYLVTFFNAKERLSRIVGDLEFALKDQKEVQQNFISSERLMNNALAKFDEIIKIRKEEGAVVERLTHVDYEGKLFIDTLQNNIRTIENYEKETLANNVHESLASLQKIVILLTISGLIITVMVILLSIDLVSNILKREELSLKLEGSEKRYHFLFELSADGIVVADLKGIITDCNKAACKIFGYSKSELVGKSYHIIWPEEKKHLLPRRIDSNTITGDTIVDRTYIRKDGTILSAEVYTKLIEINGLSSVVAYVRDITDKKQAQITITKKEEKYRNLFERSLAGIFRTTVEGKIIECNKEYVRVLGFDSIEDINKVSTKSLYADTGDREKLIELLRKQGEVKDYVVKMKKKDGSYVWVYDSVSIMYDEELQEEVLFGTLIDITMRQETELLLKASEKKYKDLAELLPQTVFEFDLNAKVTFTNKAGFDAFGYTQEDFEKGLNVFQLILPEDREKAKGHIEAAIKGIKQSNNEYTAVRKNGTTFPILIYSSLLIRNNQPGGIRGIVVDISELKQAEKEIRMLAHSLESISECVSITDDKNIIMYVNESFKKTYGFGKEELIGQHISIVQPRSLATAEIQQEFLKFANEGNWKGELINKRKDGSEFPVYLSTSIVRDSQNKPIALIGVAADITERKRAEEQILLLSRAVENSPATTIITDEEGNIEYVNKKFIELTGYTFEEVKGKNPRILSSGEKSKEEYKQLWETIKSGKEWRGEFHNQKKNGELYWESAIIVPIKNDRIFFLAVKEDITERKQTEDEIIRLNRIYAVLSNINEAIVRIRDKEQLLSSACRIAIEDGKFRMAWIGLVDEGKEELKTAASHGFIDGYLDETIFEIKKYPPGIKPISEIIDTGKPSIFNNIEALDEHTFWRKPALNRGYKSNVVFPLKVFGKTLGNFSLFSDQVGFFEEKEIRLLEEMSEDISFALETMEIEKKRKESESLFLTLARVSPVGIFQTKPDGYTTYVNPRWCQLSGMNETEAMGDGWLKAVHPEDVNKLVEGWKDATDKKRPSISEYRFLHSDGSVTWVMGQAIPELNEKDEIKGYVGTITDITSIKSYERELVKAKEKAEESDKLKTEFLAQMSHEVRSPMNAVLSFTNLLREEMTEKLTPEFLQYFEGIDTAGHRLMRTVDLVLNASELQVGAYKPTFTDFCLIGEMLEKINKDYLRLTEEKGLKYIFISNVNEAVIHGDQYSVHQIFVNLIDNATKYTKEGSIYVKVEKSEDGRELKVSITDTGVGMTEEFMKHLYQPFLQEDRGYTRRFEGNGLGLSLVKKYCDLN